MRERRSSTLRFSSADLARSFSSTTLARGRAYANAGAVEFARESEEGRTIQTRVAGSRKEPYAVVISIDAKSPRDRIDGFCTCPMARDCKHVAAVLYYVLSRPEPNAFEIPPPTRAIVATKSTPRIDPIVTSWLADLERTARTVLPSPAPERTESVAYLFGVPGRREPMGVTLPFEPVVVRRLKSGRLGKVRDCSIASLVASTANAVTETDAVIGKLIGILASTVRGRADLYEDLVRRIVVTGRAFGNATFEKPLRLGDAKPGRIAWTLAGEGLQRPSLIVDGYEAIALPGPIPLYLDESFGTIGRIAIDISPAVLDVLLGSPAIGSREARAVAATFATSLPHLRLPEPLVLTETTERVKPRPKLLLRSLRVPLPSRYTWYDSLEHETIDVAELTFVYGGVAIDPDSDLTEIRIARGTETLVHPRSAADERRFGERLRPYAFSADPVARTRVASDGIFLRFDDPADAWPRFLHRDVPALRAEGWDVVVDPSFRYRVVDATADSAWDPVLAERVPGWFDLSIGLDVDGKRLELLPILRDLIARGTLRDLATSDAATSDENVYVTLANETTVAFPRDRLRAIVRTLVELGDGESLSANGRLAIPRARVPIVGALSAEAGLRWTAPAALTELARRLRDFSGIERVGVPKGFRGTLRPYQRDGLDWLQFLRAFSFGGVLADDMGLGKSVQTIAHILCEKESGRLKAPALLVVPTSLVFNWCDEFARFAPTLRTLTLHGADRATRLGRIAQSDVVITTYSLLARDAVFAETAWHLVVLDEAQFLKNSQSKAAQVAVRLKSDHRLCLSGTPVENHLGDLWSLFAIALPGALGDRASFGRLFRTPIEKRADGERRVALSTRIRPFLLRRTKEIVASDLPEKIEIVRRVELSGAQRDLYETVRIAMHDRVAAEIARNGIARSQIVILDALLKLRQVCCDPRLLPERFNATARSIKLDFLREMLPELIEEGRRILLFSQFTSMLELIEPELDALDIPYAKLTGRTKDRAAAVERFETREVPVFLISLKAGGTGLNLRSADTVIHFDPWWKPGRRTASDGSRASDRSDAARLRLQTDRCRDGRGEDPRSADAQGRARGRHLFRRDRQRSLRPRRHRAVVRAARVTRFGRPRRRQTTSAKASNHTILCGLETPG